MCGSMYSPYRIGIRHTQEMGHNGDDHLDDTFVHLPLRGILQVDRQG